MKYELEQRDGYPIMRLFKDCGYEQFYDVADAIVNRLGLTFLNKIDDFDGLFWDFEYKSGSLTLHYNVFMGLSIFPTKLQKYDHADERALAEIGVLLFEM